MENTGYDWDMILSIAKEHWEFELSYLNDAQLNLVKQSLIENKPVSDFVKTLPGGFNFDLKPIIENAKVIFELIILIVNVVMITKDMLSTNDVVVKIKNHKHNKAALNLKIRSMDDEKIAKIVSEVVKYSKKR